MKRTLFAIAGLFFSAHMLYAQDDNDNLQYYQKTELLTNPTVQPPEAAAFQKVNYIPVSNYTGRANISIPIFTVSSGNITVPISLTYNSSGVKINDIPSSVGSNWSLNAGGMVSKIIKGGDDFAAANHLHDVNNSGFGYECSGVGFMFAKYHDTNASRFSLKSTAGISPNDPTDVIEHQPDVFLVSAPGINTRYTHTGVAPLPLLGNGSSGDIFELTGQQNRIEETFGISDYGGFLCSELIPGTVSETRYIDGAYSTQSPSPILGNLFEHFGLQSLKITSTSGLKYEFNDVDVSQYIYSKADPDQNGTTYHRVVSNIKQEAYRLSKITDQKTNKEVTFEYETYQKSSYDPSDNNYFFDGPSSPFEDEDDVTVNATKYPHLNRLKKIIYDAGSVEFVYGLNRLDVTDEKALTEVLIKDINGVLIKKIKLGYDYMTNSSYTSSAQNKRLRLDEVYTVSASGNPLPKYKFTYNSTPLPPRGSWGKDFLGYHNGTHNGTILSENAKPSTYFYPDKGIYSFLPVSRGGSSYLMSGQYSMSSNLTYAKAGVLEKIEYPTGGFSEFDYELNEFKVEGISLTGGGLRLKSQKIKDEHGNEQILDYEYKNTDNSTSGAIVSMPNFVDFRVRNTYTGTINPLSATSYFSFKIFRSPKNQAEFTSNAFVGYGRVIVKNRISNGYTEYTYASPQTTPNTMHPYVADHEGYNTGYYATAIAIANISRNNGKRSSTFDKDIYRGKLLSQKIYDINGTKLKETVNSYTYKKFGEISYENELKICTEFNCYNIDYLGPIIRETVKVPSERYVLTQSVTTDYFGVNITSATSQMTYDPIYPLVKENTINDGIKIVNNKFFYPNDTEVYNHTNISSLRSQNRFSEMIKQEAYQDNTKTYTEVINYKSFGNGIYLPEKIENAKGTEALETGAIITKRDEAGNILEYQTLDGVYTSFIYGFGNNILLAKIENATYNNATALLPITVLQLQSLDSFSDENTLLGYFDTVRSGLLDAKVSSYTYIPSVGVSTMTDNRGKRIRYVYDEFNRLSLIKGPDDNIVKRYEYNYKNQ